MDIGGWLRSLGLERYEAVFSENAIDASVLHDLTEDHLRELGFPLGARLKLLRAIAALDAVHPPSVTTSIAGTPAQSADAATATLTPETAGERRQVTVMRSSSRDILKNIHLVENFAHRKIAHHPLPTKELAARWSSRRRGARQP
jgi:hypothetical protein